MNKLIVVSNRLPVKLDGEGSSRQLVPTDGGLATALGRASKQLKAHWVGCLGDAAPDAETLAEAHLQHFYPVTMPAEVYARYYGQVSNRVLWPVLHGFKPLIGPRTYWRDYVRANEAFADEVMRLADADDLIWVHDYQLFLLPEMLRARGFTGRIGFFLHTPFPANEFFTGTPIGRRILRSLLRADTVGVQTQAHLRRLQIAVSRLGAGFDRATSTIRHHGQRIRAAAFPIGIDYHYFSRRPAAADGFMEQLRPPDGARLVLSVSRLDYTKGLPELLEAAGRLAADPAYRGRFVLRLAVIPSRDSQPEYQALRDHLEREAVRINALAAAQDPDWQPIDYTYDTIPPDDLIATYRAADVFAAPSVADGMNLVAKEYLAANPRGTLVLSWAAGAAEQLSEAILVRPGDAADLARALATAIARPASKRTTSRLRRVVRTANVFIWADNFLKNLQAH